MTRPMPGPPDPDTLVQDHPYGGVVATRRVTEADGVPVVYFAYAADKRLTDAECAAEYWRAGWVASLDFHDEHEADEASTWHRFATHPHAALEGVNA